MAMQKDTYDYLTGLYNRKALYDKYNKMAEQSVCHLMYLDLDNFKAVNDVYGHKEGDDLLVHTAEILKECAKKEHDEKTIVVRLGGDEFIILFSGEKSRSQLEQIAENILNRIIEHGKKTGLLTIVSASIGIVYDASDNTLDQLLGKADAAMYQAKKKGKSCYVFYNDLKEKLLIQKEMEECAEQALKDKKFKVFYEPVINMQSSKLVRTKVCLRWEKEDGTYWESSEFRPLFEKNKFVQQLDYYTFEMVCRDLKYFKNTKESKFCIQLSRLLLLDEELGERLNKIMSSYGVTAQEFEIDLAENTFSYRSSEKLTQNMQRLREQGFALSILRFGEDFSSIRYLKNLPIDSIKFDDIYIKENITNSRGRQIIKTLIRMGKELKFLIVALGIENKNDIIFFSSCGCDAACGNFYSKPLQKDRYIKYLEENIVCHENKKEFMFIKDFSSADGSFTGEVVGEDIKLTKGISDKWGAVYFPGGDTGKNVLSFSGNLISNDSYTISFWIKPEKAQNWASAVYMRYSDGFASYVPDKGFGESTYRISEDVDVISGWHDTVCREIPLNKWCFIVITYNSFNESVRYYVNGRKAGHLMDVPTLLSCRQVLVGGDPFQKSYKGNLSAFTVYDAVKTDDEVSELYNSFFDEPGFSGEKEDFWTL